MASFKVQKLGIDLTAFKGLIFSLARNYFLPEGFIRKPSFVVSPFNLKTELKHFLCIEILQQVTHNTNKNSIEAPCLQPL